MFWNPFSDLTLHLFTFPESRATSWQSRVLVRLTCNFKSVFQYYLFLFVAAGFFKRTPVAVTASRIAGLTTRSRASSAWLNTLLKSRTCLTTTSLLSPGMAWCLRSSSSLYNLCTSRCPSPTAHEFVHEFHGQPFARAYFSASMCPPSAAFLHIASSHGHPFSCAHFSASRRRAL